MLGLASSLLGQNPPDEFEAQVMATAWEYALEDIPTQYLDACFRRAVKAKEDTRPMSAIEVRNQWTSLAREIATAERERKGARLLAAAEEGICTRCMGAGFLVDRTDRLKPFARRCPNCEGPAPEPERAQNGPLLTWSEWVPIHKAKYPDGCDKEHCIVCYTPLKGQLPQAFGWLQGAPIPSPDEDVSQFGKMRREQAEQPAEPDDLFAEGDEDDLPF